MLALLLGLSGFTQNGSNKKATVYIFLSETCPICQSYTVSLRELNKKYYSKGVEFVGIFPNYDADMDSINLFKKKYRVPFELRIDKKGELAKHFSASITPEVFVENIKGQLLYSGRIDDSFYEVGKRRQVISSFDLDKALSSIVKGEKIETPKTQAVGCIINLTK